jgi:hypothetical protein
MDEPNVHAGRKQRIVEGFSNAPPGDQNPNEIEDWWDQPITTPTAMLRLALGALELLFVGWESQNSLCHFGERFF